LLGGPIGGAWRAIPPSSFATMTMTSASIRTFGPTLAKLALAV
jgi:hypothetical protein